MPERGRRFSRVSVGEEYYVEVQFHCLGRFLLLFEPVDRRLPERRILLHCVSPGYDFPRDFRPLPVNSTFSQPMNDFKIYQSIQGRQLQNGAVHFDFI